MSRLIRFVNHSFKHFLIHGVEDFCDGSNQFKDDSLYPFGWWWLRYCVQGKSIGEQGDEGFSGTSCMSSNQERYCAWPSNPRLDGGRSKLTLQSQYIFSDRPALGWTVDVCNAPVLKAKWILHMRRLLFAHKHSCLALPIPSIPFSFLESWIIYGVSISSSFVLLAAWYGADGHVGENAFCRRRSFTLFSIPLTQIGEREASPWKPRRVLSGRRQKEANGKVFVLK